MGVKELWGILAPVQRHMDLKDLAGQTLAVDLSIWVCEADGVKLMQGCVVKPYLRNLFFRVSHLMELGVKLVFAIEGKAPEVKLVTMVHRQNSNASRASKRAAQPSSKSLGRSRFNGILRECCELLDSMGVPHIQGDGEAEQTCAMLNTQGLVDGCITDDGDAFLYGAKVVYRNFTMNTKDPHVEMYRSADVERDIGLTRDKLVGLALLLGCDYVPLGVPGVGRELAMKMMRSLSGADVLKVFENWRTDETLCNLEAQMKRKLPSHCTVCKHPGSRQDHARNSCPECALPHGGCQPSHVPCACPWHRTGMEAKRRHAEMCVRKKAMGVRDFPQHKVIHEFLRTSSTLLKRQFVWKRPKLLQFMLFAKKQMTWVEAYSLAKLLPLITLHDMKVRLADSSSNLPLINAHCIVKTRTRQMVPCYEVQWCKMEEDVFTEDDYYTTVEAQHVFKPCFPHLVVMFEDIQQEKKKTKRVKSKKKKKADTKETSDSEDHQRKPSTTADDPVNSDIENSEPYHVRSAEKHANANFTEIAVNSANVALGLTARHHAVKTTRDLDDTDSDSDNCGMLPLSERLARNRLGSYVEVERTSDDVTMKYSPTECVPDMNVECIDNDLNDDIIDAERLHAGSTVDEQSFWEPPISRTCVNTSVATANEQLDFVTSCFVNQRVTAMAVKRDGESELETSFSNLRLAVKRVLSPGALMTNLDAPVATPGVLVTNLAAPVSTPGALVTNLVASVATPRRKIEIYVGSPDLFDSSIVLTPCGKRRTASMARFHPVDLAIETPALRPQRRLNLNKLRDFTPVRLLHDDSFADCAHFEIQTSLLDIDDDELDRSHRKSVLWDSPANSPPDRSPLSLMERLKQRNGGLFRL